MEARETVSDASTETEEVTPRQRRYALRLAVIGQCFGMPLWHCLITGGLATMYALSLDAGDIAVGTVNGALYVGIAALAFAPLLTGRHNRRWVMVTFWGLSGLAGVPLLVAPELQDRFGSGAALLVVGLCCMFYAGFYAAGVGGWTPVLRDLLPKQMARRFLGVLRMAWQCVGLAALTATAVIVGGDGDPNNYRLAFCLFLLAHFTRLFFISLIPQIAFPGQDQPETEPLKELLKDQGYRRFVFFCALCSFLFMLSVPSMYVYMVRGLRYGHGTALMVSASGLLGGLATFPLWGRLAQRRGEAVVYQASLFITLIALGLWLTPMMLGRDAAAWHGGVVSFGLSSLIFFGIRSAEAGLSVAFARHAYRLRPTSVDAPPSPLAPSAQWGGSALGALVGGLFMGLAGASHSAYGFSAYQWLFLVNALLLLLPLWLAGHQEKS